MIKKYAMNKIVVMSIIFVLLLVFYMVPTPENFEMDIVDNTNEDLVENVVYLLDEDNYVSRVVSFYTEETIEKQIREKIDVLINGDSSLKNFYSLIPKNTILKSVKIDKNNVYLDFNKEILNVNMYVEESMVEAIVFTLTEINGIDNVYINVEGEKFNALPNSKKEIPYPLNRSFGINKKYDLTNLNDIDKTTIFFVKVYDDVKYYVPVTKVSNLNTDKIDIIIDELKSSVNAQDNLNSYVSSNVVLESENIENNKMNLVFNDYIFSDASKKVILEEVKYVVAESIFENYDVDEVVFNTKSVKNIASVVKNE